MTDAEEIRQYLINNSPDHIKEDGTYLYTCPLCRGVRKLEVHATQSVWYCHKCGVGGGLYGSGRIRNNHLYPNPVTGPSTEPHDVKKDVAKVLSQYTKAQPNSTEWEYLRDRRKLTPAQIGEIRPHAGPSLLRVYFPVYLLGSSVPDYFFGRSMFPGTEPKYKFPSDGEFAIRGREALWGLHRINGPVRTLTICEGVFDAIHFKQGVALLGKSITIEQVKLVSRTCPHDIEICLDGGCDREASEVAARIAEYMAGVPLYVIRLPYGKDPDELREDMNEWLKLRERIV